MNVIRTCDFRGLRLDSNLNTPAVVISMSSIGGKEGGPLFGKSSVSSIVNTDLN